MTFGPIRLVPTTKKHGVEGEEWDLGRDIYAIIASSSERLQNFTHLNVVQLANIPWHQLEPKIVNKVVKELNIIARSWHIVVLIVIVADHWQDQRIWKLSSE